MKEDNRLPLMTQARLIPADLRKSERTLPAGFLDPPSYRELAVFLAPLIGTEQIEHVRVYTHFLAEGFTRYLDLFVDENGGRKGLPPNARATRIYRNNVLVHQKPPPDPDTLPHVFGDAVLFRDEVWS